MEPSSIMTFMSLTQAPSMFLKVLLARAMACWTASSKPFSEIALISVTVATVMVLAHPLYRCPLTTSHTLATTSVVRLNLPFVHTLHPGGLPQRLAVTILCRDDGRGSRGDRRPGCSPLVRFILLRQTIGRMSMEFVLQFRFSGGPCTF